MVNGRSLWKKIIKYFKAVLIRIIKNYKELVMENKNKATSIYQKPTSFLVTDVFKSVN